MKLNTHPARRLAAVVAISTSMVVLSPFFLQHRARAVPAPHSTPTVLVCARPQAPPPASAAPAPVRPGPVPRLAMAAPNVLEPTPSDSNAPSNWAAYAGIFLSAAGFGFQIARNWKVKKQNDVSMQSWLTWVGTDSAWAVYGYSSGMPVLGHANAAGVVIRAAAVYHLASGHASGFRSTLLYVAREATKLASNILQQGYATLTNLTMAAIIDPLNTLIFVATVPALMQFQKTNRERQTAGLSLLSQVSYLIGNVFWGINGLLFERPAVVAASMVGFCLTWMVLRLKREQMRSDGHTPRAAVRQDITEAFHFLEHKISRRPRPEPEISDRP